MSAVSQKSQKARCAALSSPPSHSKDKHNSSPQRTYKWAFQLGEELVRLLRPR